jgi:endonuclease YncB( thermonuclease family)
LEASLAVTLRAACALSACVLVGLALTSWDWVMPSAAPVVDGDTVRIDGVRMRLLDIDAPEIFHPRCARESNAGAAAKARLAQLLAAGPMQLADSGEHDRYGRPLVRISVNGQDLGQILLQEGLAVVWRPGPAAWEARRQHWCSDVFK